MDIDQEAYTMYQLSCPILKCPISYDDYLWSHWIIREWCDKVWVPKFTGCVIAAGVLSVFKKPCYITTLEFSNVVNDHPKIINLFSHYWN